MAGFQGLKTVDVIESRRKDPCKSLWRNVLIVAIEDAIKSTVNRAKWKMDKNHCLEIDYVTEPNQDFATICHYADLDHTLVRSKVKKTLNKIKEKYEAENNMPEMQREWLHTNERNDRPLKISETINKTM